LWKRYDHSCSRDGGDSCDSVAAAGPVVPGALLLLLSGGGGGSPSCPLDEAPRSVRSAPSPSLPALRRPFAPLLLLGECVWAGGGGGAEDDASVPSSPLLLRSGSPEAWSRRVDTSEWSVKDMPSVP
jgi:hypothetical protein